MGCELEGYNESCEEIEGVLAKDVSIVDRRRERRSTFRKGRPRLVVFIMCEEEAWGEASRCMAERGM